VGVLAVDNPLGRRESRTRKGCDTLVRVGEPRAEVLHGMTYILRVFRLVGHRGRTWHKAQPEVPRPVYVGTGLVRKHGSSV